jgi:hypothetical protein
MKPDFAVALNNRAWAKFRLGRPMVALVDVSKALQLSPTNPHFLDTRAHIRKALGDTDGALRDLVEAMARGPGSIKLYQCGPARAQLYTGETDGIRRPALDEALESAFATRIAIPSRLRRSVQELPSPAGVWDDGRGDGRIEPP